MQTITSQPDSGVRDTVVVTPSRPSALRWEHLVLAAVAVAVAIGIVLAIALFTGDSSSGTGGPVRSANAVEQDLGLVVSDPPSSAPATQSATAAERHLAPSAAVQSSTAATEQRLMHGKS